MEIDLHGYHPAEIVFNGVLSKILQQAWEMGESDLTLIHGHGRNRAGNPKLRPPTGSQENASAASVLSAKTAARGRLNVETGKSNQSAPKAQATPINNTSQPTLKRSKRTTKRHTRMARGFTWGSEDCFILRCDVR